MDHSKMKHNSDIADEFISKKMKCISSKSEPLNNNNNEDQDLPCSTNTVELKNKKVTENYMGIEDMLICGICQDIMYNCVSIQPCLHTYCAYCLLKSKKNVEECPSCRSPIIQVSKNHLVGNIVDKFLAENPDRCRSEKEKTEEDLEVKKNFAFLFNNQPKKSKFRRGISRIPINRNSCRICNYPGKKHDTGYGNYNICRSNSTHVQCNCCHVYIPTIIDSNNISPATRCKKCNINSCWLLFGHCDGCDLGCLFVLKDFIFNSDFNHTSQVPQFIPDNFFETSLLRDFLNQQNMTLSDMYNQCLNMLSIGNISLDHEITDKSALCINCAKQAVLDLIYQYFVSIPKSSFGSEIASRPDCYYGKNCRTQRHKQAHCVKYNHCCPQTKF